jgi:hypothetical protein
MRRYIATEVVAAEVARLNDELVDAVGIAIGKLLDERCGPIEAKLKQFRFCGAWTDGTEYLQGNFVTQGGAIFHAQVDTKTKPGVGDAWLLVVPRARDGRDAR